MENGKESNKRSDTSTNSKEAAINRLIILHVLKCFDMPVQMLYLSKFFLKNKLMNFMILQHEIETLLLSKLIVSSKREEKTYLSIEKKGIEMLENLSSLLPEGIKKTIFDKIKKEKRNARNEMSINADFIPSGQNGYDVKCSISENNHLLVSVELSTGSRQDAKRICENWKNNTAGIYNKIIEVLTKTDK